MQFHNRLRVAESVNGNGQAAVPPGKEETKLGSTMRSEQEIRDALKRMAAEEPTIGGYTYDDNPTIALGARHILRWVLGDDTGLFGDHAEYPNIPVDGAFDGDEQESFIRWAEAHYGPLDED
jgi:hypothetical protein